ncbi:hypothetical protein OTK49_02725 [Vibrio coralliirubri]|uniref:hypothetical protein n=1 Tax=Vibrio coralliirubri TaxID=1516159 RepID=UPI0022840E76|nr:hypothetical protein [Vibrio coralliirubri]MCY9861432.1 hypothetical protein [Vibrio coralliirubri]
MKIVNNLNMLSSDSSNLRTLMRKCEQTEGLSVLEHGLSVAKYYKDLIEHLKFGNKLKYEWRLPEWVYDPIIMNDLLPSAEVLTYLIYHDCGKPFCLYFDENGNRHFPNHADLSYQTWVNIYGDSDVAWLMKNDMEIHLARAIDASRIASRKYWSTQLLSGLAAVHSNAGMFGGTESTSFKIKLKNLNKMGKRILQIKNKINL